MDQCSSILIVDDDDRVVEMLDEGLSQSGYACQTASSAELALSKLQASRFDILITDIVLDGVDGLELTRKAKLLHPDIVVIVMTGFIKVFTYDNAVNAGASDFITKPFTLHEILARIRIAVRQEQIRTMAITDELTGLLNRRGFIPFAEQQIRVSRRAKESMSLLYADLDNLKKVNDTFGHREGDRLLVETSNIFRKTFRSSDILGRLGGDEFAALLPDSSETSFSRIRDRLCENIQVTNSEKDLPYDISVSVGMTLWKPDNPCSLEDLLFQCDSRMYENKKTKKSSDSNQIC